MIANPYYSPPTRQPIDVAECAYREGAPGFPPFPGCGSAASSIRSRSYPNRAVERGADGVPAQAPSAPTIEALP